jgi:hypothetical protein
MSCPDHTSPKLVKRCREFETCGHVPPAMIAGIWHRLGIAESINTPENRRPA